MTLFARKNTASVCCAFIFLLAFSFAARAQSNSSPVIVSTFPPENTVFLAGVKVAIHVIAADLDREALQYQFSIGGTIKQPWSSSKTFFWQTSVSDTGTVSLFCEARDPRGGLAQKAVSFVVINPSTEEVLKKVSDNYSGIRDFKADTLYYSMFNGKAFGDIQNCRYFFAAPDKEKIETFADSGRTVKTEIIISHGAQVYLIDPQNRSVEEANPMESEGINPGEIDYMDIYYNQPRFLSTHSVGRLDAETNFGIKVICLEAYPLQEGGLYSKLLLYVDYNKGILAKTRLYHKDALLQTIEVTSSKKMPGGEWIPLKMSKTPALSAGKLVSTMAYANIQINPGLSQDEFDPDKQY